MEVISMSYRTFISIGNEDIEKEVSNYNNLDIVETERELNIVKGLIEFLNIDFIIINSLLADSHEELIEIVKVAHSKGIKVVLLIVSFRNVDDKKIIGALVNYGVNAFLELNKLREEKLLEIMGNYPKEFNFKLLSEGEDSKVIEVNKSLKEAANDEYTHQNIVSILTDDNNLMRDYFAVNLAAVATYGNKKSIIVDLTKNQFIINFFNIKKERSCEMLKEITPVILSSAIDKISNVSNLDVLRINNNNLSNKMIRNLIFALREYQTVIFVMDDMNICGCKDIITDSNNVCVIVEPSIYSCKKNIDILNEIKEVGQIDENIKIIATDYLDEFDLWTKIYEYNKVYELNREVHLKCINSEKIITSKKDMEVYKDILCIKSSKSFLKAFRR